MAISVFLLRDSSSSSSDDVSSTPSDSYSLTLHPSYSPTSLPVLSHHLLSSHPPLSSLLASHASYSGIILTSQRAVDALRAANTPLHPRTPVFVVGPATAAALAALPSHLRPNLVLGAHRSGNAARLAEYILEYFHQRYHNKSFPHLNSSTNSSNSSNSPPLLFLAGQKHTSTLADRLSLASIPLQTIIVYKTSPRTDFAPHFTSLLHPHISQQSPFWVVCFSPTGAQLALDILLSLSSASNLARIAAIGPTTKSFILQNFPSFTVHALAASPDPQSLLDAMQQYDSHLQS